MPSMRNLIWLFSRDPRDWQRPEETDEAYILRRRREAAEDRIKKTYDRIVKAGFRRVQ